MVISRCSSYSSWISFLSVRSATHPLHRLFFHNDVESIGSCLSDLRHCWLISYVGVDQHTGQTTGYDLVYYLKLMLFHFISLPPSDFPCLDIAWAKRSSFPDIVQLGEENDSD